MIRVSAIFIILVSAFFCGCKRNYSVQINNLYTESLDSVVIGDNKIVFTEIPRQTTTEKKSIQFGQNTVTFISKSKKRIPFTFTINKKKAGDYTIQIDGTGGVRLLIP